MPSEGRSWRNFRACYPAAILEDDLRLVSIFSESEEKKTSLITEGLSMCYAFSTGRRHTEVIRPVLSNVTRRGIDRDAGQFQS